MIVPVFLCLHRDLIVCDLVANTGPGPATSTGLAQFHPTIFDPFFFFSFLLDGWLVGWVGSVYLCMLRCFGFDPLDLGDKDDDDQKKK